MQDRKPALDEAQLKSLELLEKDFAPVRAALEWQDEPAEVFRADEES